MAHSGVKWAAIGTTVLRMAVVILVLVIMPIWALTGARCLRIADLNSTRLSDFGQDKNNGMFAQDRKPSTEPAAVQPGVFALKTASEVERRAAASRKCVSPDTGGRVAGPLIARGSTEEIEQIQLRLRQMGAAWMRLERLDSESSSAKGVTGRGGLYQFSCRMPLPENPTYSKQFVVTASKATDAMRRVTEQIQRWIDAQRTAQK